MAVSKRALRGGFGGAATIAAIALATAQLAGAPALAQPDGVGSEEIGPERPTTDATPMVNPAPEDDGAPGEGEVFFNEETWRALVEGKTLYYRTPQGMIGREYYPPGSNRAVFEYAADNSCYEGSWTEVDGKFCFNYDGTHCFYHLKRGDEIFARQMDGVDQKVIKITREPFSCGAELTS